MSYYSIIMWVSYIVSNWENVWKFEIYYLKIFIKYLYYYLNFLVFFNTYIQNNIYIK